MASTSAAGEPLRVATTEYSFRGTIHAEAKLGAPRFFDIGRIPSPADYTLVHEVANFVRSISQDVVPSPSFENRLRIHPILSAVETRAASQAAWQDVSAKQRRLY